MICPYCHRTGVVTDNRPCVFHCTRCGATWSVLQNEIIIAMACALSRLRAHFYAESIKGISMSPEGWKQFVRENSSLTFVLVEPRNGHANCEFYGYTIDISKDQEEPFLFMVKV